VGGANDRNLAQLRLAQERAELVLEASRSTSVEAMALMGHETESMFVPYALNDVPMLERAVAWVAALDG
jgi:hypothetical protein